MPDTNESASLHASARAMDAIATAVAIVTARDGETIAGQTVRGVVALGDATDALVCGIDVSGPLLAAVTASGSFRVNIVAVGSDRTSDAFAGVPLSRGADFSGAEWERAADGGPSLRDCLATFSCALHEARELDAHAVLIGRILDVGHSTHREPLLMLKGDYRRVEELPLSVFADFADGRARQARS